MFIVYNHQNLKVEVERSDDSRYEIISDFEMDYEEDFRLALATGKLNLARTNPTYEEVMFSIIPFLSQNPHITQLDLACELDSEVKLGNKSAKALAAVDTLEILNLNNHDIGTKGLIALSDSKSLKILRIFDKNYTKEELKTLTPKSTFKKQQHF